MPSPSAAERQHAPQQPGDNTQQQQPQDGQQVTNTCIVWSVRVHVVYPARCCRTKFSVLLGKVMSSRVLYALLQFVRQTQTHENRRLTQRHTLRNKLFSMAFFAAFYHVCGLYLMVHDVAESLRHLSASHAVISISPRRPPFLRARAHAYMPADLCNGQGGDRVTEL